MEKIKEKYNKKYPNCEKCIWFKYNSPSTKLFIPCADFLSCELKDHIIHFPKIKAKICKWYSVKRRIINNEI